VLEEKRTLTNKTNEKQGKGKTPRTTQAARQNSETEKALNCAAAKDKKEKTDNERVTISRGPNTDGKKNTTAAEANTAMRRPRAHGPHHSRTLWTTLATSIFKNRPCGKSVFFKNKRHSDVHFLATVLRKHTPIFPGARKN